LIIGSHIKVFVSYEALLKWGYVWGKEYQPWRFSDCMQLKILIVFL